MALEYTHQNKFELLAPVLEDYAAWFGQIAVVVAYPEDKSAIDKLSRPSSFKNWVDQMEAGEDLNSTTIEEIVKVHDDMLSLGMMILEDIKADRKATRDNFVEFKNTYTAFLMRLRRLEKDSAMDDSGIDEATGLRSAKTIQSDLKKENERLSRQGNPFSLVMTRIDDFALQSDKGAALAVAVANIKRCMRTFDDAYYLENGHFLLSLKHADLIGAQAATSRLQNFLEKDETNTQKMSMSYCMAEPVSGDDLPKLLENMKQDLADHQNDHNAVLKFLELSALERFVHQMGQ